MGQQEQQRAQHTPRAQMELLMASRPQAIEDVDQWLTDYLAAVDAAREIEKATERLHKAAPDLLAALQNLLEKIEARSATVGDCNEARAAIASATGSN